MKTFKEFLKEAEDKKIGSLDESDIGLVEPGLDKNDDEPYNTPIIESKLNESNWDMIYAQIMSAKRYIDNADDMWLEPAPQENYINVIKTLQNAVNSSQKAIQLLKKYKDVL